MLWRNVRLLVEVFVPSVLFLLPCPPESVDEAQTDNEENDSTDQHKFPDHVVLFLVFDDFYVVFSFRTGCRTPRESSIVPVARFPERSPTLRST